MRLFSNGFTLSLQCRYDCLIRLFLEEELGSQQPLVHNLVVYAVRGNTRCPAGHVHIASKNHIVITLYKAGIDKCQLMRHQKFLEGLDGKKAFNTFVLLHEVAHVIQAYRDWDAYKTIIESVEVSCFSNEKEREADQLAVEFIKRHRLFSVELIDESGVG